MKQSQALFCPILPFWGGKRAHFSHGFADEPSAADAATTDEGRKKAEEAHFRHGFTRTDTADEESGGLRLET